MINDLVVSNDQFNGDTMKYANITDQAENNSMQEVTNFIVDWSERTKFQLNPSKCKEFVVYFKRNEPTQLAHNVITTLYFGLFWLGRT